MKLNPDLDLHCLLRPVYQILREGTVNSTCTSINAADKVILNCGDNLVPGLAPDKRGYPHNIYIYIFISPRKHICCG